MSEPTPTTPPAPPAPDYGNPAPAYGTPAPGYGPPLGYAAPPYPPMTPRTNGTAIAALVTGLLGFALIPVVLGHLALRQVRRTGEGGGWMAVVGLVLGYGMCALYAALLIGGGLVWFTAT